jgi:hypothetical protein
MVRRGFRGWAVEYKNGKEVFEGDVEWKDIIKNDIKCLSLHYDGREWHIENKKDYYQKKRASAVPGVADSFRIESRSIGYYSKDSLILYTVDEHTGRMNMEVKDIN